MKVINGVVDLVARLFRFITGLLGGVINILAILTMLGLSIYISWNHVLELVREAGAPSEGYLDVCTVALFEIAFLFGSSHALTALMKKRFPGWFTGGLALYGLTINGYGNYHSGEAYGWLGMAVGIAIPLAVVLSKGSLAETYQKENKTDNHQPEIQPTINYQPSTTNQPKTTNHRTETTNQPENKPLPLAYQSDYVSYTIPKSGRFNPLNMEYDLPTNHMETVVEPLEGKGTTTLPDEEKQLIQPPEMVDLPQPLEQPDEEKQSIQPPEMVELPPADQPDNLPDELPNDLPDEKKQSSLPPTTITKVVEQPKKVIVESGELERALSFLEDFDQPIGRVKLQKLAGVSDWAARKAIERFKEAEENKQTK